MEGCRRDEVCLQGSNLAWTGRLPAVVIRLLLRATASSFSCLSLVGGMLFGVSGHLLVIIIIIIKGHSLRRACLQPVTNTFIHHHSSFISNK